MIYFPSQWSGEMNSMIIIYFSYLNYESKNMVIIIFSTCNTSDSGFSLDGINLLSFTSNRHEKYSFTGLLHIYTV